MPFQGSLKELPLPDVIQLVAVSGKTGRFSITSDRERGSIFLRDGQVVHAEVGELSGEEAFYELAVWNSGEFLFAPGEEPAERSIEKTNTNLLMEAARRLDEWKILAQRVPSTRLVPKFKENTETSVSLDSREWRVVRKIDERRSIEKIAREIRLTAFETAKIIYGLITSGLVELDEDMSVFDLAGMRRMSVPDLKRLVEDIHQAATSVLGEGAGRHLEPPYQAAKQEIDGGRGSEAVLELIRAEEKAISVARGPHQAKAFLASLASKVGPAATSGT